VVVTTTPRPTQLLRDLVADPTTAITRGTTLDNKRHLAPTFFERILGKFEGTRLGRQEIDGEILEVGQGAWFDGFQPGRHVTDAAEYHPGFPVHLAIDCGVSRHVGAVWFQLRGLDPAKKRATVFADFHAEGLYSEAAAKAIWQHGQELPSRGVLDTVRLDPAANARTGIGPTAAAEFRKVFGERSTDHWPAHRVADGLDQVALLLDKDLLQIHPRCAHLTAALQQYVRKRTSRGDWLDEPADPQHPHEDLVDALRGGIRDRFPEGRLYQPPAGLNYQTGRR
jgi:hypothetical protein